MSLVEKKTIHGDLNERLTTGGFRSTPQREHVYNVLLQKRDHPTAEEIFIRSKKTMPDISMATVYNCLDALVKILLGGALLVLLTYGCFVIKYREHLLSSGDWVPGFTNRSFAAGSNAAAAVLLYSWIHFRTYWESRHEHLSATDMDAFIIKQVFQSLDRVVAVILCTILTVGIGAMDFVTPGEFNFPILYALPVVIAGLTERRLILWATVLVVVILTLAGFCWGPPATPGTPAQGLMNNRLLALCMLAGTGLAMHVGARSRGLSQRIGDSIMARAFC